LNFEENLYLHYNTESIHTTKIVTLEHLPLPLSCGTSLLSAQQPSASILELHFALASVFRGGNILVKSLSVLIGHCPDIFWEEV
jgi:hypothetical protein